MGLFMIVCDYIDDKVKNYLNVNKSKRTILTFFKEPFDNYKGNKVIFIDDVLDEEDYREIDIFINKVMKDAEEIFSKYLEADGYKLFDYLQLQAKRNLSKAYRLKYSLEKVLKEKNKVVIQFFCSEVELLEWLKQDHKIESLKKQQINSKNKYKSNYKYKIKKYLKNSLFANYMLDRIIIKLFKDYKNKPGNILWMGGRSYKSKVINELKKNYKIFLLPQFSGGKLAFLKRGYRFELLKLKNNEKFNKKCDYLINQYEKGLEKIAFITDINKKLLEIILKINKNILKDLLLTLIILEDNKKNIDLLIVEQSVIGKQALAVDFFYKNKIFSIEVLHGVPGVIEVGKTDKIAVYGQRDKSFLNAHGVEKSKIVITGCSYYDRIFNIKEKEKNYDYLLLIPVESPYLRGLLFKQIINVLNLLKHFQDERLVIKLHPAENEKALEYIRNLAKNIIKDKNRVKVTKEGDVIDLLKNAKIVYVFSSSVGVEALLMKKPLIILDYLPNRPYNYEKYGGCLVVKDYKNLELSTEKILKDVHGYLRENNENIEQTRRYFSGDLKGESYKNVARLINEMLDK
jgi:hypothetical protein